MTVGVAGRCLRLTGEMGKVRRILGGFLDVVGEGLGEALINYTEELIPSLNSSKTLDPIFFEIVAKINVLIQRIDLTWMEVMKEGGGKENEESKREEGLQKKEKVIQKLENMLHKIIKNGLASLFILSNSLLSSSQKKKDFLPDPDPLPKKPEESKNSNSPSDACKLLLSSISEYIHIIKQFGSSRNHNNILNSLGSQLIQIVKDHWCRYKVNSRGLLVLKADLKRLEEFFLEEFEGLEGELEGLRGVGGVWGGGWGGGEEEGKRREMEKKMGREIVMRLMKNRVEG